MLRKVNERGLNLIKEHEGCILQAYVCPAGRWTIGYGATEGVRPGQVITRGEAECRLKLTCMELANDIDELVQVPLNDNQLAALVSFAYNVGLDNLRRSTLLRLLNLGQYDSVPAQLSRWVNATVNGVKRPLPGLVKRRAAEADLWEQPT